MDWISRKLDTFLAAAVIAVAAIAACQAHVFMVQYMRQLGAEVTAAQAQLHSVQTGLRYKVMNDGVRAEIEADARKRAATLQSEYDAVAGTNPVLRPLAFVNSADRTLIENTWRNFVPALPINVATAIYVLIGMIVGFALYEIVKLPVSLILREPPRRRFRKRG